MNRSLAAVVVTLLWLAGCGSGGKSADAPSPAESSTDVDATLGGAPANVGEEPVSALAFVDVAAEGSFTVEIEAGAPQPTTIEVDIAAAGTGRRVGATGVALVSYVAVGWDGDVVQRSSDIDDRLSVTVGNPPDFPPDVVTMPNEIEGALVGKSVGTRLVVALPAGTTGMPKLLPRSAAHLLVLDILAFQTPVAS